MKLRDLRVLRNINFNAKLGDFIAVIGRVASGKSSFLHSLIRGMEHVSGSFKKNGSIAYVP
jgi:ATP-binding cassette subfamily C (CFTR/MRP) protein 1